ncbi:hypothetical protein G3I44_16740 [Halogeometricum borinquense]|uniref:Uncharacterized protein n=1 Tax=Halogeometricum borinquense TaxID=60847 RepID=A0A6C0US52_9EURY|nr:hypothetical protein [Halogeometricum borinquense]QIB75778.1 hypothetical protein G3I44_16740 [Halogeometricum borinquense]
MPSDEDESSHQSDRNDGQELLDALDAIGIDRMNELILDAWKQVDWDDMDGTDEPMPRADGSDADIRAEIDIDSASVTDTEQDADSDPNTESDV